MRMWWMIFPLVAACNRAPTPTTTTTTATAEPQPVTTSPSTDESEGVTTTLDELMTTEALAMTLSEGTTGAGAVQRPTVAAATPLQDQPLERLLLGPLVFQR